MRAVSAPRPDSVPLSAQSLRLFGWLGCAVAGLLISGFGCSGSATVQFVSLHASEIDPPPAKVFRYESQETYWWIDSEGKLNIALRCKKRNAFLGRFGVQDFVMSIMPGEPPAGSGRNYAIRRRDVRAVVDSALQRQRLNAYAGVLDVLVDDARHVHGSFRIWMRPQRQPNLLSILPQRPGNLLCFGTFKAVLDARRGRALRAVCESQGRARPPTRRLPASQPRSAHVR